MNTRLLFGLLWLTPTLCFGALSTDTSYFLNVEALTNVTARSAVRGLTGVFTNGVTSASLTSTGYVQSPVPYSNPIPALATPVAASEINTSTYDAFASMQKTPSGKLLLFYRTGTNHAFAPATIAMRTSTDTGKTWSSASTVASDPSFEVTGCAAGIGFDGSVLLSYTVRNHTITNYVSLNIIRSTDDGVTWGSPISINTGANTTFLGYGDIIQIGAGKLGFPWYGINGTTYTTYFATSSDNGLTWSASVAVATATGGAQWTEASYAYLGGGAIIGMLRNNAGTAFTQYKSLDNGATWASQGDETFDTWAATGPATVVPFIADGKLTLACYYADRTEGKIRVVYGDGTSLLNGPTNWVASTVVDIASVTAGGSGYVAAVHPYGNALGVVSWYSEKSVSDADLNFAAVTAPTLGPLNLYAITGGAGMNLIQAFPSEGGWWRVFDNSGTGFLPSFEFASTNLNGFGGGIIARIPAANDVLSSTVAGITFDARQGASGVTALTAANLFTWRNGATQVLTIDKDGEMGIGTASISGANSTLHVAGSHAHSIATGTAFTLTGTNEVYLVNVDAQTVTLPTAVGINGRTYTVKAIAPCTVATVATTSSQLIDGATTYSLSASNKFVRVISDNAKWWIIGNN